MSPAPVIAVVGAGFSGALTALRLLRSGPAGARILLVEKAQGFGRGLAYAAHNPNHLLNVRVENMSAFPEQPDHLAQWLADRARPEACGPDAFITRGAYGDYLTALLKEAITSSDGAGRLVLVADQAVGLRFDSGGGVMDLAMGRQLRIDAMVLALGNLPPIAPAGAGLEALGPRLFARDPWARGALEGLDPEADVLLLGSGLTMVDIALDLVSQGHRGRLIALSRRGLVPHRHAPVDPPGPPPPGRCALPLSWRLHERRRRAAEAGWRRAVDEIRPIIQDLWRTADQAERRRFLRHLRPWWEVHRHRMAPAVADRLDAMRGCGSLKVTAGRLMATRPEGEQVRIEWRPRGGQEQQNLTVGRIVNCTGVGGDLARTTDPLLRSLIDQGAVRPDALSIGLEIDGACRVVAADGGADRPLYAVGPISRGYSWEVTAVPDIRNQVVALAGALTTHLAAARSTAT